MPFVDALLPVWTLVETAAPVNHDEPAPAPHSAAEPEDPVRYWFADDVASGLASVGTA
jgi:hypothetical protein